MPVDPSTGLPIGSSGCSGRIAQLVERFPYKEDAGGSSPSAPTSKALLNRCIQTSASSGEARCATSGVQRQTGCGASVPSVILLRRHHEPKSQAGAVIAAFPDIEEALQSGAVVRDHCGSCAHPRAADRLTRSPRRTPNATSGTTSLDEGLDFANDEPDGPPDPDRDEFLIGDQLIEGCASDVEQGDRLVWGIDTSSGRSTVGISAPPPAGETPCGQRGL